MNKKHFFILLTLLLPILSSAQIEKAKALIAEKKYQQAKKIYLNEISANPLSAEALNGLANLYALQNKTDSAVIFYEKAAKLKYPDALYNLGKYYFKYKSDLSKAIYYLTEAYKLSPDSANYALFAGIVYQAKGQMDTAFDYYKIVLEKAPDNPYPFYFIAEYMYETDSLQMAYDFINEAIARNDKNYNFFDLKASIEYKAGLYKNALNSINKALELKQTPELVSRKAKILYANGMYSDVIKLLEDKQNKTVNDLYFLSWAYYNTMQYNNAIELVKKALELAPEKSELYELQAYIYLRTQNYDAAIESAQKLTEIAPNYYNGYALLVNAKLYKQTDKNVFDKNLYFSQINIRNLEKINKLIQDKESQYFYPKLWEKFKKNPDKLGIDQYFMLYWGYALQNPIKKVEPKAYTAPFKQKNYAQTILQAQKAISAYPFDTYAYFYLANAYLKKGDKNNFIKYLTVYHGLLKGMSATGPGTNFDNAYLITHQDDEYFIIDYTKGNPSRALSFGIKEVEKDGKKFNVVEIAYTRAKEFQIFFYLQNQ